MPTIYIIAGCNGAGKTTASLTILPEILQCREFVNADNIAAGLSPFHPEKVAIEAGRIMLTRIQFLMANKIDFAFETTLSTKSFVPLILNAQSLGYKVHLLFFWLIAPEFAQYRVSQRVKAGGHHIPDDVVERRFYRGIYNLINLYIPVVDQWLVMENMEGSIEKIAQGNKTEGKIIVDLSLWKIINHQTSPI